MSRRDLDLFLRKKVNTPLNTDIIYGGNAPKFDEDIKIKISDGSKVKVIEA